MRTQAHAHVCGQAHAIAPTHVHAHMCGNRHAHMGRRMRMRHMRADAHACTYVRTHERACPRMHAHRRASLAPGQRAPIIHRGWARGDHKADQHECGDRHHGALEPAIGPEVQQEVLILADGTPNLRLIGTVH